VIATSCRLNISQSLAPFFVVSLHVLWIQFPGRQLTWAQQVSCQATARLVHACLRAHKPRYITGPAPVYLLILLTSLGVALLEVQPSDLCSSIGTGDAGVSSCDLSEEGAFSVLVVLLLTFITHSFIFSTHASSVRF
jgi:hypothetical protein